MPTAAELKAPFVPEAFYHLVCKSIDGILLFAEPGDFRVYKERFKSFTSLHFEVWGYCLLSNHTHYIVKTKPAISVYNSISYMQKEYQTKSMQTFLEDLHNEEFFDVMIERQMNSFLVSYSNYCNNKRNRTGGLFQKPFKRIRIHDEAHLQQAIIYTHANAQKHKLIDDFKKYDQASYTEIINCMDQFTEPNTVIEFFGGKDNFVKLHEKQVEYYYQSGWPSSKLE